MAFTELLSITMISQMFVTVLTSVILVVIFIPAVIFFLPPSISCEITSNQVTPSRIFCMLHIF